MILTSHILAGAAIGSQINNPVLAATFAFISHFVLDFIPHPEEYNIDNLKTKKFNKYFIKDLIKVFIDFILGFIIVFYFSRGSFNFSNILIGAFFGALPDGLQFLSFQFNFKFLQVSQKFHIKVHFFKYRNVPQIMKFSSQIVIALLALLILAN